MTTSASTELQQALALLHAQRVQDAEALLAQFCAREPDRPDAFLLLGMARHMLGRVEFALAAFERCLALDPVQAQAASARALMLALLGRKPQAREAAHAAAALRPGDPQNLANAAIALEHAGERGEALALYERALAVDPRSPAALMNRGVLLLQLGRFDDALANNRRLVECQPDAADAHFNLAEALLALDRGEEALQACDATLRIDPRHVKAAIDRGLALSLLGRLDEARDTFARAKALDPQAYAAYVNPIEDPASVPRERFDPRVIYLNRAYRRMQDGDWRGLPAFVDSFERHALDADAGNDPIDDPALMYAALTLPLSGAARLALGRAVSSRMAVEAGSPLPATRVRSGSAGPINVGYIGPSFRRHPTAYNLRRLYALHDRSRFRVHAYSLQPGDGSEVRRDIEQACDTFRELSGADDRQVAQRIRDDGIDVLIDLGGYTEHSRIGVLALRPAPVQVGYQAFAGTTGAGFVDYAIVDRVVCPPGADRCWSEKLVYLPETYFMLDDRAPVAASPANRAEAGLPEQAFVFCCFNNGYKIEPGVFEVWMRLVKAAPEALIWLLDASGPLRANIEREATLRGVSAGQLVFAPFVPREQHLARYRCADLFLDTFWYNAHTTAAEALFMGLPVLTCPGAGMPARVAASLNRAAGMDEMNVGSVAEYEARALRLATDRAEMARLKARLAANRADSRLFDTAARVLQLESAYVTMVERSRSGLAPESFEVSI